MDDDAENKLKKGNPRPQIHLEKMSWLILDELMLGYQEEKNLGSKSTKIDRFV